MPFSTPRPSRWTTPFADICERLCHEIPLTFQLHSGPHSRQHLRALFRQGHCHHRQTRPRRGKTGSAQGRGVFYTPEYIVRYIVENTVGRLIEGKTPAEIAGMRFADIACGSGSCLLRMFDLLLRRHREWLNAHPGSRRRPIAVVGRTASPHFQKKREILTNTFSAWTLTIRLSNWPNSALPETSGRRNSRFGSRIPFEFHEPFCPREEEHRLRQLAHRHGYFQRPAFPPVTRSGT